MSLIKAKGMNWLFLISIVLIAMPTWVLANNAGEPNIEVIKQLRQLQNQNTIANNLKANTVQVKATPEQEQMLRLAKALSEAQGQQSPNLKKNYRLKLGQQGLQAPQSVQSNSREVIYNQGVLSATPGLEYFNFLTGMNSADSADMDVRITGNEGTNFGDEFSGWVDPSLLYFMSPMGTLDTVQMVSDIDDPMTPWNTVSWATNGYQPLTPGDLFVVYTRTTQMYVALEVTDVDTWGQYFEFDYMIQTDGSPFFGDEPSTVVFNSGEMSLFPDSLYFNYFDGVMGSDTLGMDVMITSNEGTNFGSESAWIDGIIYPEFSDPSLLHYYSEYGSLDTVNSVPSIDDPSASWTTISWDWNGGNNGQPLAVGNLWVIYTRTTNMYVVMEITDVDVWGSWFAFDYMIQTDGSNEFDGGFIEPSNLDLTVNGLYADSLEIGSNPYFEITLDASPEVDLVIFWDSNHNGEWDEMDFPMDDYLFMDNDLKDEDPAPGIYGFTFTDEMADGLNYFADDLLFVAFQGMDMSSVLVEFYSEPTPYSVSGYVYEETGEVARELAPLSGIVVWASYGDNDGPAIVGVSDEIGYYHLVLPDSGMVYVGTEDHFMMTDGLVPIPPMHEVMVIGDETDFDFVYDVPVSFIQGYVYDEADQPVVGIEVRAQNGGPSFSSMTDETGFYSIGLMPGWYRVEIDWWSLPQPYMLPPSVEVTLEDGESVDLDLLLLSTNNMISGTVLLDGVPSPETNVWGANPDFGWTATISDEFGNYELPVFDDGMTPYNLGAHFPDMPNVVQVSENSDVPAGTMDEMILLETLFGGMHGFFINTETGEPIVDFMDVNMRLHNVETDIEFYSGPNPDGWYEIWVPDGLYELVAGGPEWTIDAPDTILIEGAMIDRDIFLYPIAFDTFVEGQVFDNLGTPIPDAEISIGNGEWGTMTYTDLEGFYHINAPYGFYGISARAEGFEQQWSDLDLTGGPVFLDFFLMPFIVDGAITGHVFDEIDGFDIPNANVFVFNELNSWGTSTDEFGTFWMDVPNGEYTIAFDHSDYATFWLEGVSVNDDTLYLDIPMAMYTGGLEGYVTNADNGNPVMDAQVMIVNLEDSTGFFGNSGPDGYYNIPVLNGDYEVFAQAEGYEPAELGMISIIDSWEYLDISLVPHEFATPPEINFIIDEPNDQGRQVRMQFWPGGTEWGSFSGYSVWRMTHTPMGEIFDFVEYIPNHEFDAYNLVAPTLVDSSAFNTDPEYYISIFIVTGHWDTYGFIDGEPGFGWSVDNINPGIPGPLALLSSGETGVEVGWELSMDEDFQYFQVHRANNPDFVDADVILTVDPGYTDEDVSVGETYYYRVNAVDSNGNIGDGTNVVSTSIVSVDDAELLPTAFGLSQNYPNPFNPTTSIEFALPQAADVSLVIYNLLGQKVRTLVNGYIPAGYINTNWDGLDQNGKALSSGTYIYQLKTADMSFSKKMVLMK